jgi:membrane protease YdiL (CAAX protease family)
LSANSAGPDNRDWIQEIFISEDEPRLRAGWRLLAQTVLIFVLGFCVGIPLIFYFASNGLIEIDIRSISREILLPLQIAQFFIFTLSVYLARRFLDKRSFTSLGLIVKRQAVMDLIAGIIVSFLIMGLMFAFQLMVGWAKITIFAWDSEEMPGVLGAAFAFLVIFALTGWNEELLFRGYHLQTIASGLNTFWGVLISSVVFSIAHFGNPGAAWNSIAGIFLAGLFFAYAYLRSGQLWLPIGLHFGWNFFEGVVFGFPVSGLEIYNLMRIEIEGPELWTGGGFGPEAGLILIPGLLLGTALIYYYTKLRQAPG